MNPPFRMKPAIISRLKIMAELDIAERRCRRTVASSSRSRQESGRARVHRADHLRREGVLRILDQRTAADLSKLGFDEVGLRALLRSIDSPYGMVLVTGPTGSGKTTTLYSALARINTPVRNIMTAEDPVEYNLEGINQVLIHEEIGLTFAAALKAFLRQDPNVIMVARSAISTPLRSRQGIAHRPSGVVHGAHERQLEHRHRLIDMGVEPFLVASSLNLILARGSHAAFANAARCKSARLGRGAAGAGLRVRRGRWCCTREGLPDCNMTGYPAGGLYEVLP